jgi:hypothetical protein
MSNQTASSPESGVPVLCSDKIAKRNSEWEKEANEEADLMLHMAMRGLVIAVIMIVCWWLLGQARMRELNRQITLFITGREPSDDSFPLNPALPTPIA